MQHGRMVMQDHLSTPHFAAICNKGIVFDLMSQHREGTHMRNQPQFDLLSPLYSNPPLWPGAGFVRGHNSCEPKEIPRADLEGLVRGDSVLADGNIIRRFVWFSSCMYAMGHLWFPRFSWQTHAIWSVWCSCMRIMPPSYQILRCICFVWLSGFPTWAPNGVGITFFLSLFLTPSLCYFDVSHYAHGWRSIRIDICEKGLVWWDVAIVCV